MKRKGNVLPSVAFLLVDDLLCDQTADFVQRQADRGSSSWSFRKTGTQGGAGGVLRSMVVNGSDLELAAA